MDYIVRVKEELSIRGYSKRTQEQYIMYISNFIKTINKDPQDIKEEDITSYLAKKKEKLSNTSLNNIYAAIHFFVKNILKSSEMDTIKRPKVDKYLPTVLTKEEVKRLFDSIEKERDRLIVELIYSTGLRVSEVVNLKLENIDINEKLIKIVQGKGNKDRVVILSDKWLKSYLKFAKKFFRSKKVPRDYAFCKKNGKPLSVDTIQRIIKLANKESGIKKHITPHTLRHSFATHLLQSGTDLRRIQTILGHANISTTQIYTKVDTSDIKRTKSPFDEM